MDPFIDKPGGFGGLSSFTKGKLSGGTGESFLIFDSLRIAPLGGAMQIDLSSDVSAEDALANQSGLPDDLRDALIPFCNAYVALEDKKGVDFEIAIGTIVDHHTVDILHGELPAELAEPYRRFEESLADVPPVSSTFTLFMEFCVTLRPRPAPLRQLPGVVTISFPVAQFGAGIRETMSKFKNIPDAEETSTS